MNKTVSDTNMHVLAIEIEQKTFIASISTYFKRTAVLENHVAELRSASVAQNRVARDALST